MSAPSIRYGFKRQYASASLDWDVDTAKKAGSRSPGSLRPRKVVAGWEARLAAEGLAPLDWDLGGGCIAVSERGAGKVHADRPAGEYVQARAARETHAEIRQQVLAAHRFRSPRDRRIWGLYAQLGNRRGSTRAIAAQLGLTRWQVRQSIARTLREWRERRETVDDGPVDLEFGAALSEALRGCPDATDAFERARALPELVDYLGAP